MPQIKISKDCCDWLARTDLLPCSARFSKVLL